MKLKFITDDNIKKAVINSISYSGVLKLLNLNICSGSIHSSLKKRIATLNLDVSHFKGHGANYGEHHKGCKKSSKEILIIGKKQNAFRLRRSLVEIGREYKCSICNLLPIWNNEPLLLQVDHIDGNRRNNLESNLRFVCPNCHTQTINWGRGKSKDLFSNNYYTKQYREKFKRHHD